MEILSWNVNGLRAVVKKEGLQEVMKRGFHIICLQETRVLFEEIPREVTKEGYHLSLSSAEKRGYSGVMTLSKLPPDEVRTLGVEEFDREGRVLISRFGNLHVVNCYFPNSQEGGKRLPYKLAFCEALEAELRGITNAGGGVVVCGDFNVAHREIDLKNPKANRKNPGFLPEECEWIDGFLSRGFVDSFRWFYPDIKDAYTWWSYRFNARENNVGWRIDYHCINRELTGQLVSAGILSEITGSDHCPVVITLRCGK